MKKSIVLLPLLLLAVTACNMNSGSNSNNKNNDNTPGENQNTQPDYNKVLSYVTLFPEVGDQINLDEYATEEMYGHSLSQYTFTSSDNNIIEIQNYKAVCKAGGYATVTVEGPGLETPAVISFWTGSIAGTYTPYYPKSLRNLIRLEIGEVNEERVSNFSLHINAGSYKGETIKAYDGSGTMFKNGTPFLAFDFAGSAPKDFSPISDYLALLGLGSEVTDVASNVYGYLTYDFDTQSLNLKTVFRGSIIEFEVQ